MGRLQAPSAAAARLASGGAAYARCSGVSTRQRQKHHLAIEEKLARARLQPRLLADRVEDRRFRRQALGVPDRPARDRGMGDHRARRRLSDTWQLVVNTRTMIVTFLMVFLIQNSQNRDARAIHLKLDELLRATPKARTVTPSARADAATARPRESEEPRVPGEACRQRVRCSGPVFPIACGTYRASSPESSTSALISCSRNTPPVGIQR